MVDIIIIGGGIGGLSAALGLQRQGRTVRVYEQTRQFADVGAGISISPSASRGLFYLGLKAELERDSDVPFKAGAADYRTGELHGGGQVSALQRGSGGIPIFHQIHRADLHKILLDAVLANDAGAVEVGKQLTRFEDRGEIVEAEFADGSRAEAPILVGCDGVNSKVREQLFGEEKARFTGQVAYRFLLPMEQAQPYMTLGSSINYVGPGRGLLRYVIRHGAVVNAVAFVRTDQWTGEGWSTSFEPEELLRHFEGWHEDVLGLIRQAPRDSARKWALFDRDPLPAWTKGRVTLLGDAAHPMLPFLGLGAAMGVEDGVVLARALTQGLDDLDALRRYEMVRRPRTAKVQLGSRREGELQQLPPEERRVAGPGPGDDVELYSYDPATVPLMVHDRSKAENAA
jgi:salicylate hydroxylase